MEIVKIDDFEVYSGLRFGSNFVHIMPMVYKWLPRSQKGVRWKSIFVVPTDGSDSGSGDKSTQVEMYQKICRLRKNVISCLLSLFALLWQNSDRTRESSIRKKTEDLRTNWSNFFLFSNPFFTNLVVLFCIFCSILYFVFRSVLFCLVLCSVLYMFRDPIQFPRWNVLKSYKTFHFVTKEKKDSSSRIQMDGDDHGPASVRDWNPE